MNNQQGIIELIKSTSGQANLLTTPRLYVRLVGDITTAIFLSQCVYWSDKTSRADGYFYKSAKEWEEEIGIKPSELQTARERTAQFITTKLRRAYGAPTLHYKVNFEALSLAILEMLKQDELEKQSRFGQNAKSDFVDSQNPFGQNAKSLTETTTEITQENKVVAQAQLPPLPNKSACQLDDFGLPVEEANQEEQVSSPPKSKRGRKPDAPKPPKTEEQKRIDKLFYHPAVKLHQGITHISMAACMRQDVVNIVGDSPENLEKWGVVLKTWMGKGKGKPQNVIDQLDIFQHGWKIYGNQPRQQGQPAILVINPGEERKHEYQR